VLVDLREEEEDEEDSEDDQTQYEPTGPAIPGAATVCASEVVEAIVVAAGSDVSRASRVYATSVGRAHVAES
jgi:hypothetical protein